jgi:hypothetical protein
MLRRYPAADLVVVVGISVAQVASDVGCPLDTSW